MRKGHTERLAIAHQLPPSPWTPRKSMISATVLFNTRRCHSQSQVKAHDYLERWNFKRWHLHRIAQGGRTLNRNVNQNMISGHRI